MGYSTRDNGIRTFWPDNTEEEFFLDCQYTTYTFSEILWHAEQYFGAEFDKDKLHISAEYIHCDCLGYDQYDPGDYNNFIKIRLEK